MEVSGNILDYKVDEYTIVICHQTNCQTKSSKGLSKQIFDKYPETNIYYHKRTPGEIIITQTNDGKFVFHLNAQDSPGKPSTNESKEQRLEWFKKCISEIRKYSSPRCMFLFPYGIGCGLAGGNWNDYHRILLNSGIENLVIIKFDQ